MEDQDESAASIAARKTLDEDGLIETTLFFNSRGNSVINRAPVSKSAFSYDRKEYKHTTCRYSIKRREKEARVLQRDLRQLEVYYSPLYIPLARSFQLPKVSWRREWIVLNTETSNVGREPKKFRCIKVTSDNISIRLIWTMYFILAL